VSGATSEAIRNSRRHAGADATVTADIDIDSAGHVTVVVEDDGVGFDPTLLQPGRLGLSMSIRRRLLDVGGRAVVESTVGEGTRVTIEWPAP
jgi:signal transduction histidine kinase